jgi:hypothetical protein
MFFQENNQRWRVRNTFLEFDDREDNDFAKLARPSTQRSASVGSLAASTARVSERGDLEQEVQMQQDGHVAKRGGGVRVPYCAPGFHVSEESRRDTKTAVALSFASLTNHPTTSSDVQIPNCAAAVENKQKDSPISQEATTIVENPAEKDTEISTAMIRHIACRYTQDDITSILNEAGFAGKYNWIYLPMNPQKNANLGYVFVNFVSPQSLDECRELLDDQIFGPSQTTKRCQVTLALLQGPRIPRKPHRKGKDKRQRAALAIANDEADGQACSSSSGAPLVTCTPRI